MQTELNNNTTFWDICKRIFSLALPMTGSQLINVGSGFLCMAMLAKLGHEVLAASALIYALQLSILVSGMSILFSISVLVGHANGAKEYRTAGNYLQQGWLLGLMISVPIMILFWHMGSLLLLFHQSTIIANIVQTYFHAFVWAVIPGFISSCNMQFGYGIQKKKLMFFTSLMSVPILLITAYVLIFGKFGFPQLGVAGLAYATAAQTTFYFLFSTFFFRFNKSFEHFELFKYRIHQHGEDFSKMLKIGLPIFVQMGGEMLSFSLSGIMIGWLGIEALAALQIVNQYYFLIVIPIFSLSQASGILVGQARGAKQFHEIKKLSHASFGIAFAMGLLVLAVFLLFPKNLASVYMNVTNPANAEALHLTILLFAVYAFTQLFDGQRNILIGVLRGLFDTRFSMVMSLCTVWLISMPLAYVLAFPLHFGVVGFTIGGALGMLCGVIVMAYRWQTLIKKY